MWPLNKVSFGLGAGAGVVVTALLSWAIHTIVVSFINADHATELRNMQITMLDRCTEDKAITKGANDALQKNYNDVARRLAEYKRMHPASCIVPSSGQTLASSLGAGHAGQNGISTDWLREYAAECNGYRAERIVLDKWADDVVGATKKRNQ